MSTDEMSILDKENLFVTNLKEQDQQTATIARKIPTMKQEVAELVESIESANIEYDAAVAKRDELYEILNSSQEDAEQAAVDLENRVTEQKKVNLQILGEISAMQENKRMLADAEFELKQSIETATVELEETREDVHTIKEGIVEDRARVEERNQTTQKEINDINEDIEQLQSQNLQSTSAMEELVAVQKKNKALEELVELVKDSVIESLAGGNLTFSSPSGRLNSDSFTESNAEEHRHVRFSEKLERHSEERPKRKAAMEPV
eukprot:m.42757 g.42757  ORF g.42757 m.42757 type:complete len:263 (+) comp19203_c0_seq1:233-1021(+)